MKKTFFILCLMAVALTSCDPGYLIDYRLNSANELTTIKIGDK